MRIGEIATIQPGHQFRGKVEPDPDGDVALIQIKDIEDRRRLNPHSIDRIAFDKAHEPYLVSRGDVLFLSRGHKLFALAIEHDLSDTIASGYFYILRLRTDRIRPAYLAWCINQPPFQSQLAQLSQGSHMPFVSKTEFQELPVPIPPLALQDTIVALSILSEQEQAILSELASKRAALIQTLTLAAAADDPSATKPARR